jgi:hypothetical protein
MKWPAVLTSTNSILFLLIIIICLILYFIKKEGFTSSLVNKFINTYPEQPKKEIYNLTASNLSL